MTWGRKEELKGSLQTSVGRGFCISRGGGAGNLRLQRLGIWLVSFPLTKTKTRQWRPGVRIKVVQLEPVLCH